MSVTVWGSFCSYLHGLFFGLEAAGKYSKELSVRIVFAVIRINQTTSYSSQIHQWSRQQLRNCSLFPCRQNSRQAESIQEKFQLRAHSWTWGRRNCNLYQPSRPSRGFRCIHCPVVRKTFVTTGSVISSSGCPREVKNCISRLFATFRST
jgi:hypothetical protein